MDIELHDAVLPADSHVARTTIVDPDGSLSEGEEAELYTYYGIPHPTRRACGSPGSTTSSRTGSSGRRDPATDGWQAAGDAGR